MILLEETEKTTQILTTILGGAVGAGVFSLIALLINNYFGNKRYKKELKTFLWKEKIEASKKASEFYLEYMNFINTSITHFEILNADKNLVSGLEEAIELHGKKLSNFTNFNHHHINVFIDLFDDEIEDKSLSISINLMKIRNLSSQNKLTENVFKGLIDVIKSDYKEVLDFHKNKFSEVRNKINEFID